MVRPMPRPFHRLRIPLFALVLAAGAGTALAQVALPGAVAPTPEGAAAPRGPAPSPATAPATRPKLHRRPVDAAGLPGAPATAKVVAAKVLPAASLAGQTLYRGGRGSEIAFALRDKTLVVSHLTLAGRGDDGADCRIDVADLPLAVRDEGEPSGMARIGIPVSACPMSFDVLDGAALETGDRANCSFAATHCTVDPGGLWGPAAATLTPDRDKAIERQRSQAETAMRANFKRLVAATRDRPTVMGYAREQAQFSSTREEMCRGYVAEVKHGFCSTRLTDARAAALRTKADIAQAEKEKRKARQRKRG
ncbi:hypothetical protein D3272_17500 [Lichenibacterium ramalinae]|uniref:DUF1311 domain-containing protein n=2 Tax=Lichenibacterium ramalinae TaxID=2316527 RepID=A0A4Q2RB38_9HYPH|nr:hypothetical protein D3272_17500 [Lichenibacterium ramalinae]